MQTVWNVLTRRAIDYGINDYDVFYFDPDTSWEAEDTVIRTLTDAARKPRHRGRGAQPGARSSLVPQESMACPIRHCIVRREGIDRFLTRNTQIGIRRTQDGYEVYAPNGFDDVAALIVRPNPGANFSAANYEAKAARWKALWPEITVLPAELEAVATPTAPRPR